MTKPDLSEFHRLSRPRKPPCRIGLARAQLDDTERINLDAAFADAGVTVGGIAAWLAARGHDVSLSAVSSHQRTVTGVSATGRCSCADA